MPCALLGDRASGKTTFLGLLYSAQVKYGTGVQDDFRFHAPIQSLNIMSAVYEGMKDGRFPSATLKEEITELGFVFGYLRRSSASCRTTSGNRTGSTRSRPFGSPPTTCRAKISRSSSRPGSPRGRSSNSS